MANPLPNINSKASAATKQMVVQCPSCQTKFALDSSIIEGVEQPRFHCSRCDHVFSMEESHVAQIPPRASVSNSVPTPPSWTSKTPVTPAQPPKRRLEIPEKPANPLNSTPPHETGHDPETEDRSQMSFPFSEQNQEGETHTASMAKGSAPMFSIRESGLDEELKTQAAAERLEIGARLDELASRISEDSSSSLATDATQMIDSSMLGSLAAQTKAGLPSWRGFTILCGAFLIFLTLLAAGSLYLRNNTGTAASLVQTVFPAAERLAPPSLYIKNTKIKKVTLDGGDSVYVVSGKVVNQSEESFRNIMVEVIAFDSLGKPVVRTKVNAANTLAKTRIKSLTLEMIRNLQTESLGSILTIKPGQDEEFAIALGNGQEANEIAKARYFSARIYSVRS